MTIINSLRGTCDILPGEIQYWHYIETEAKTLFEKADYEEIRTPLIEVQNLFERGIGKDTDIISKEMYNFQDKGKRNITLRPEGTAGIARCFIEHKLYNKNKEHKFWYSGPMFRYERPQYGRQRQFTQIGIEILGIQDAIADAEAISLGFNFLKNLNLQSFYLEINSIGSLNNRRQYTDSLTQYLKKYYNELDEESQYRLETNPLRILDSKNEKIQEILEYAPNITYFLDKESKSHFDSLKLYLDAIDIPYEFNHKLVRGLDYYNNTAFEFKAKQLGSQNTICGGGRYDTLIEILGGPATPAIGWAIGLERLIAIVKHNIDVKSHLVDFYIISDNTRQAKLECLIVFNNLVKKDYKVKLDLNDSKIQKKLKKASNCLAKFCIIIGEEEIKKEYIIKKDMSSGLQDWIKKEDLLDQL
uniref:Histidine--tRNA ligase, chloroplastic n=1 Tax=Boldia erythrosiphon TaxID=74908 RepID=A0A1Y9TLT4_9RHOD|nr:histidine tRNA synthetase [Boldia erythrosiphon]ARO90567.1 histidine tRNA synthetase [Boldia erythrosiphon]